MNAQRAVPALLLVLLAIVQGQLWFGRGNLGEVAELERQLQAQLAANAAAKSANERLASEVRDLQEGLDTVEEKARLELGMVRPNEVFVQIAR